MAKRRRWISRVASFLLGVCLGLIARYLWPGGLEPPWAWLAYVAVGTVAGIWALAWLALLLAEKLP
jgi:Na+/melibiose symporter-like transporter